MLYNIKNPHGGDIYGDPVWLDFSANTNPFGTPEGVLEAVRQALPRMHRYPDPYCRKLVRAISAFEQVPESRILCGNGAAELIYAWCQAVKPRYALELAPTFSEYRLGLNRVGGQMEQFLLRQEQGFRPGMELADAIGEKKPDAVFLCNPNNPTGLLMAPEVMGRIVEVCRRENIRLFADECFLDFTEGGESLKRYLEDTPQLFILKAFTKSYGMAGIRLGYGLSGDPELLKEMSAAVQPWNVSGLAQAAGTAALQEQEFLERTRELVARERGWLQDRLEALGLRVCPSQVNFLLFQGPESLGTELRKQGIAIRSCDNYYGLGPGWFRIAVRLPEENRALIEAISRLTERK